MKGYLGEVEVKIKDSIFKDNTKEDWILCYVERYGQFDGSHHKQWVMDQIARIIHGTEICIKKASWDNGQIEWRFTLGEPTKEYWRWVEDMKYGDDGEDTYDYDFGVAP